MIPRQIEFCYKYQPLFELLNPTFHSEIDTVIITGGRYSLKSYTVSIFSLAALVCHNWNVLYTRFTNSSITDSVKPEVSDKIDLLGYTRIVKDTESHIEYGKNRIAFKGIKPGAKSQTANLKSLSGFNCFVNDEAEELPDFATFKKVYYSIRSVDKRNLSILILNPTDREHWIHEEFFDKREVEDGWNGIKGNVMYIHSSYLDADFSKMPPNILAEYERLKIEDEKEYNNIILGGWLDQPEGIVFDRKELNFLHPSSLEKEKIIGRVGAMDTKLEGTDYFATIVGYVYSDHRVFIQDVIFSDESYLILEPLSHRLLKEFRPSSLFKIETNAAGIIFYNNLRKKFPNFNIVGQISPGTSSKLSRILLQERYIKNHFIFRSDYKELPHYNRFMKNLTTFLRTGKSTHDDAADVCAMLSAALDL
jgi:predicted phage terminase large subunit-like protein